MPHIHIQPDQHDMTASAYIIMRDNGEWKCLVHMHKKVDKLMQIGGHIELNETPWQAVAHEIQEESGYTLEQLDILQPFASMPLTDGNIVHPVPFTMNTHNVGDEHYHSDLCYGFVASSYPKNQTPDGESNDLRWCTLSELWRAVGTGEALKDMTMIYEYLIKHVDELCKVSTRKFSLEKPFIQRASYKFGSAGEQR